MKLRLIIIGRDRKDPLCIAADAYLDRVRRYYPIELIELKETPARAHSPVDRVRADEAMRIRKTLGSADHVVALDEAGRALDSKQVAGRLECWSVEGRSNVSFVIGGPQGLDRAFLASAQERWSLSPMTLPHRLARLVLSEQLYRACTIVRGEPYHK